MLLITFSKAGHDDIVLTEDDLFDWDYEDSCFSSDTFELGGVNAKSLYLLIDNNDRRFSRGTFSNSRATLEIDGRICGEFNVELPKRRDGVIEITAYNDMIKLDCEYPSDYVFPQVFWSVYAQCLFEAGLTEDLSFDNFELNALFDNGVISADYTDYIYANSCRQLISGMAEWNGGFAHFNSDNKLQVDVFSKEISHEFYSGQLMELDYSDETITFSKLKTSFKNKTYEKGDDSGYTLVIRNQYISYGLTDENFETYLTCIYDYYKGFTLTPMSLVLAEPDFDLKLGDRISVYDEEEDVTVVGNISKINITGNCTMTITCGGFGNISSSSNYKTTSQSAIDQAKTEAENTSTSLSALVSYAYLTDTSAKFNGITYTAEKDDSGLIVRITDNKSGAFVPEVSGEITDVAFHNAVFMAVAMVCGLGKTDNTLVLYDEGDECSDITGGWRLWHNANATATEIKYDDYMYIKSENTGTQYAFVLANTYAPIDLTKYTKLHFEVIAPATNESVYSDYGISVDEPNDTWSNITQSGFFGRFDERTDVVMDITDRSGLYYVNLLVDRGNELKIYKVWLEK